MRGWYSGLHAGGKAALPPLSVPRFLAASAEVIADLERRKSRESILDAAWHEFTCILIGKAEEATRRVVLVNPAGTSITCHQCGTRCARPVQDTVICPACGPMDADVNGAINIASGAGLGSGQVAGAA